MSFTLWPAIDLKEGKCVRLLHGDMEQVTTYSENPGAQAWSFRDVGFSHLHVVDLDGAVQGTMVNDEAVKQILYETDAKVQLGGGIRDLETVEHWLDLGVSRVILGTLAVKDPDTVRRALREFPGRIVLGVDARNGFVATDGWEKASTLTAASVVARFDPEKIAAVIYTDIGRDGALTGPNVTATKELAEEIKIPVLASGGIADTDDLQELSMHRSSGIAGAILGRSLYEGTIDPIGALALEELSS